MICRTDTNSFLDFVKLILIVAVQIVQPDTKASNVVLSHVRWLHFLCGWVWDREHEHVFSDAHLSVENVLDSLLNCWLLLIELFTEIISNSLSENTIRETELWNYIECILAQKLGRQFCFGRRVWETMKDLRPVYLSCDFFSPNDTIILEKVFYGQSLYANLVS
jgi:hypothetical protein